MFGVGVCRLLGNSAGYVSLRKFLTGNSLFSCKYKIQHITLLVCHFSNSGLVILQKSLDTTYFLKFRLAQFDMYICIL